MPDIITHKATGATKGNLSENLRRVRAVCGAGKPVILRQRIVVKIPGSSVAISIDHSQVIECRTPDAVEYARKVLRKAADSLHGVSLARPAAVCAPDEGDARDA